jgi:hypothetical protein
MDPDLHRGDRRLAANHPMIRSAARQPIIMEPALVLADTISGITEASATRKPSMPMHLQVRSNHIMLSLPLPIRQVPTGWYNVSARERINACQSSSL